MSGSSDSEEFFDAEDLTPSHVLRRNKSCKDQEITSESVSGYNLTGRHQHEDRKESEDNSFDVSPTRQVVDKTEVDKKITELHQGRQRFRELRQRMQTDDEDTGLNNASPPDSQTSSVEGVFAVPSKTSHPFRIIEHDTMSLQSMTSLGRVGRILGGVNDTSGSCTNRESQTQLASALSKSSLFKDDDSVSETSSLHSQTSHSLASGAGIMLKKQTLVCGDNVISSSDVCLTQKEEHAPQILQEPDVIASTKNLNNLVSGHVENNTPPVAPPRKKKKSRTQTPRTLTPPCAEETYSQSSPLPSPASTIESLTREFEHSLDIRSATKGQYVVKPQWNITPTSSSSVDLAENRTTGFHHLLTSLRQVLDRQVDCHQFLMDEDRSKAEGPSVEELERIERLKTELFSTTSSQASSSPMGSISSNSIGRGGSVSRKTGLSPRGSKERRRSAGDEHGMMSQLNMFVRTRTDSGKQLTDLEILEQVTVLNLDTGERVPLSIAEDKLPQCINPLSLHIMRLTSEYVSNSSLEKEKESDEESVDSKKSCAPPEEDSDTSKVRRRTAQLKKFLGSKVRKTMDKAKSIAHEVSHARHKEDVEDILDDMNPGEQYIKLKVSGSHKGPYEFDSLQHVQDLSGEHAGPVWCMKFSSCGRLLATAGQDRVLRIWVVRNAFTYFQDMRTKYNAEKVSPTPSQESLVSQHSSEDPNATCADLKGEEGNRSPFMSKPFCTYTGHTSDLLDVSWSKNYFVLSSSMDKTVRLWHISRKECLCCFQHIDFVTAIVFHPRDDRYFLSGSLDGKLRLWNIPDKKVAVWNEVDGQTKLITAANFCQNGKFAVVGSYDGRCIFYNTDQLKYHTQIHVRSTRGKNSTGRKISGIEPMPGEDKILVTSNDSRIRLYDLRDLNLSCKYKGYVNVSSQIKASFSHDGKYIVSGSENQCIYIWKTHHDYSKFSSVRRDRNDFWEGIKAHNAVVTCAVFAPNPDIIIRQIEEQEAQSGSQNLKVEVDPMVEQRTKGCGGYVLVSADFNGGIKVFLNKMKPKHSSLPASALA
ncbi:WD repeat-containing protein 44 isoform X2 [Anabrus simplex]|uniref:WD repeat-containing protein 44 isoform X2 n=1 Tax=Anabrus simplex TaxID=316456 RepID=UPI0035A3816C